MRTADKTRFHRFLLDSFDKSYIHIYGTVLECNTLIDPIFRNENTRVNLKTLFNDFISYDIPITDRIKLIIQSAINQSNSFFNLNDFGFCPVQSDKGQYAFDLRGIFAYSCCRFKKTTEIHYNKDVPSNELYSNQISIIHSSNWRIVFSKQFPFHGLTSKRACVKYLEFEEILFDVIANLIECYLTSVLESIASEGKVALFEFFIWKVEKIFKTM